MASSNTINEKLTKTSLDTSAWEATKTLLAYAEDALKIKSQEETPFRAIYSFDKSYEGSREGLFEKLEHTCEKIWAMKNGAVNKDTWSLVITNTL